MLDSTSRRRSSTAASAVSASAAVRASVSTSASGPKSVTGPRRCGRSLRAQWRWSTAGRSSGSCSPRWTISSSWPCASSSSTMAAPMNRVPPSTITRMPSEPQAGELLGVALPLARDPDVQVEEDARAEQALQLGAGAGADLAQHRALAADQDRLLAWPLHVQVGPHHQHRVVVAEEIGRLVCRLMLEKKKQ